MCRWLAYSGAPIYLEKLLFEPENSLIQQSLHARKAKVATNGDGFGVGWYGDRATPGIYREILPAWNDRNLKSLAHQVRAPLFFAHVRASTGTATARANCHPFSADKWLFMHNGQIGGYERIRRRLDALIPDDLYNTREGSTDSELIFMLLFRHGLADNPVRALERTTAEIMAVMGDAGTDEPFRLTATLTDGETIWAVRFACDDAPPSLYWCESGSSMVIVSEPLDHDQHHQWNSVPNGHMLQARRGEPARLHRFTPAQ